MQKSYTRLSLAAFLNNYRGKRIADKDFLAPLLTSSSDSSERTTIDFEGASLLDRQEIVNRTGQILLKRISLYKDVNVAPAEQAFIALSYLAHCNSSVGPADDQALTIFDIIKTLSGVVTIFQNRQDKFSPEGRALLPTALGANILMLQQADFVMKLGHAQIPRMLVNQARDHYLDALNKLNYFISNYCDDLSRVNIITALTENIPDFSNPDFGYQSYAYIDTMRAFQQFKPSLSEAQKLGHALKEITKKAANAPTELKREIVKLGFHMAAQQFACQFQTQLDKKVLTKEQAYRVKEFADNIGPLLQLDRQLRKHDNPEQAHALEHDIVHMGPLSFGVYDGHVAYAILSGGKKTPPIFSIVGRDNENYFGTKDGRLQQRHLGINFPLRSLAIPENTDHRDGLETFIGGNFPGYSVDTRTLDRRTELSEFQMRANRRNSKLEAWNNKRRLRSTLSFLRARAGAPNP